MAAIEVGELAGTRLDVHESRPAGGQAESGVDHHVRSVLVIALTAADLEGRALEQQRRSIEDEPSEVGDRRGEQALSGSTRDGRRRRCTRPCVSVSLTRTWNSARSYCVGGFVAIDMQAILAML